MIAELFWEPCRSLAEDTNLYGMAAAPFRGTRLLGWVRRTCGKYPHQAYRYSVSYCPPPNVNTDVEHLGMFDTLDEAKRVLETTVRLLL